MWRPARHSPGLVGGTSETRFAGVIRTDQNWIGGRGASLPTRRSCTTAGPVPGLLDDLVQFVNRTTYQQCAGRHRPRSVRDHPSLRDGNAGLPLSYSRHLLPA